MYMTSKFSQHGDILEDREHALCPRLPGIRKEAREENGKGKEREKEREEEETEGQEAGDRGEEREGWKGLRETHKGYKR